MTTLEGTEFTFKPLPTATSCLDDKGTQELLAKWSLQDTLRLTKFSFTGHFRPYQFKPFLKAFFESEAAAERLAVLKDVKGTWGQPGPSEKVQDVDAEEVPTTALSMEFFDKLYTNDILRRDGSIKGCIPECLDNGMEINQEITKVLHMPESEQYDMFVPEERQEFLFQLFSLLVTGGPLNQYEDNVGPYFDLTRSLYKDCVTVAKNTTTNNLHVTSHVFAVSAVRGWEPLFPLQNHVQNRLYVCISPTKRVVTVLYNAWCGD